jgi:hypothetical protein
MQAPPAQLAAAPYAAPRRDAPAHHLHHPRSSNPGDDEVVAEVLRHVEATFDAIRLGLQSYCVSDYVRATLLQPATSLVTKQVRARIASPRLHDWPRGLPCTRTRRCLLQVLRHSYVSEQHCSPIVNVTGSMFWW